MAWDMDLEKNSYEIWSHHLENVIYLSKLQ